MLGHFHGQLPEVKCVKKQFVTFQSLILILIILRTYLSQFLFYFIVGFIFFYPFSFSDFFPLSSFTLTMLSVENLSSAKEKHNTALSEQTAVGTCPAKMGAISVSVMVQQLQDSNIFQTCPRKHEHYKSKKNCGKY